MVAYHPRPPEYKGDMEESEIEISNTAKIKITNRELSDRKKQRFQVLKLRLKILY